MIIKIYSFMHFSFEEMKKKYQKPEKSLEQKA